MKATISIVTYNAVTHARWCLDNVFRYTPLGSYELILSSNSPQAAALFEEVAQDHQPVVTHISNGINEGFIKPNERAFEQATGDIFIMLNDDAIVGLGWLEVIFAAFKANPNLGACGPHGCRLREDFTGGIRNDSNPEYIEGCCLAINSGCVGGSTLFDPTIEWAYCDDSDLCLRLRDAGCDIQTVKFPFAHCGGTTTKTLDASAKSGPFARNHALMRRKWHEYLSNPTRKFSHE